MVMILPPRFSGQAMKSSRRFRSLHLLSLLVLGMLAWTGKTASAEWPFDLPRRPELPTLAESSWCENPVDLFILARLKEKGLSPSRQATRRMLIRRLSVDLTGLLPSPGEVKQFLNDPAPDAWPRLVDRFLGSPRYGEHWGQHWLDVVRYADSDGFEYDDPRPFAWRYRDWVIQSLNSDKSFQRFVREQVAGDEIYPSDLDALVATGMQRLGPLRLNAGMQDEEKNRQEVLTEMTDNIGSAFLGLTIACARCHDHKFDAFSQQDYFRLQSFFAATQPVDVTLASEQQQQQHTAELEKWQHRFDKATSQLEELREKYRSQVTDRLLAKLPAPVQAAVRKEPEERTADESRLVAEADGVLKLTEEAVDMAITGTPQDAVQLKVIREELAQLINSRPEAPLTVMAAIDPPGTVPATHVLNRGEPGKRLDEVQPTFPGMLTTTTIPTIQPVSLGEGESPGRRRALADWIASAENPLTARVFVNRLWHHHLGHGIVATPNDFGAMGAAASHPELLDYLTAELIDSGWSIKQLHRLILLSATYRQQSELRENATRVDPENKYLWRAHRRRMDAEVIRDTVLQVSGQLDLEAGGPAVRLPLHPEIARLQYKGTWYPHPDPSQHMRRSIYVFVKRNNRPPLLENFDSPSTLASCGERSTSTHAGQALSMMNSAFLQKQSLLLARRLGDGQKREESIRKIYRLALSRSPTRQELRLGLQYLAEQERLIAEDHRQYVPGEDHALLALAEYCQVILNLDEFLYVE